MHKGDNKDDDDDDDDEMEEKKNAIRGIHVYLFILIINTNVSLVTSIFCVCMLFYSIWHSRGKLLLAAPRNTSFMLQNLTCSITPPYQHREMKIQTVTYETHSDTNTVS